ncbi:tyrosine-type recombinase/integrase [Bradyrhizobium sp. Pha-3]|uniref:tyrosine-type recombinase/integrase n=1 Tax=Bradyrhizobium sp. Pha-3 TaxID=208375 RepID=UPI0035D41AA8
MICSSVNRPFFIVHPPTRVMDSTHFWRRLRGSGQQVLLHGKGRRDRVVPIPQDLVRSLTDLSSGPGPGHHEPRPIFVGAHNERLTRFGATHIVRRAASQAGSTGPSLEGKPISPHIFRHSLAMKLLRSGMIS